MQKLKKITMITTLLTGSLFLQGCDIFDWLLGPCDSSCYSPTPGRPDHHDRPDRDDRRDRDDHHSGRGPNDREPNPPRFEERPSDPGRDREVEDGRNREREERDRNSIASPQLMNAAQNLVQKYQIQPRSAMILAEHLIQARVGGMHTLVELGITQDEINAMIHGENPSANMLKKISQVLEMDVIEVHELIQKIKLDIQFKRGLQF
jgi:hypothetical protein